jgi:beta-galactosidase
VNGKSAGSCSTPISGYIFQFPQIQFTPGKISVVAKAAGKAVGRADIETADSPARLKLTPHVGPKGFVADGSDVALFDIEAVDSQGRRCPTDEGRVDFKLEGPAVWQGGYNSGKPHSVNNLWLDTECGINRVAIRSTSTPGAVTVVASRSGLESVVLKIESKLLDQKRSD